MKLIWFTFLGFALILASCATVTYPPTASPLPPTPITPSATARNLMLPTWTPAPTLTPRATPTPRKTSTPLVTPGGIGGFPTSSANGFSTDLLLDRPTYSQLLKPANLVTMEYDPSIWALNTSYPTLYMGYSLTHRSIYECTLEPSVGQGVEGYQVEHYSRPLGSTEFEVARVSQAGVLVFSNYCTGEGEDYTCYKMTPGVDHTTCTQAAEAVLASFKLIPNPFYGSVITSPNRWACEDEVGTVGLCAVSYSVPLNALALTPDGQAWAAGDDGILFNRVGRIWSEVSSPTTHPLYDLSFSSLLSGWAVGDGAQALRYDGNEWSEAIPYHDPGEGPGGSTQVLYAVDAYTGSDVWMVGVMTGIDGKHSAYALHWNGTDLIEETAFPECNCGLNAVFILNQDDVFAAGGSDLGAIVFHWDGSTWSSTLVLGADHLYALSQATDGTVWAAGIEVARDQSDTRGALFNWDGTQWQRIALPPLTGGIYALAALPTGQIVLGGDFTALQDGLDWQPITTDIAGFGWIVDIELDLQGNILALTRSGNLFELVPNR